jgi:hypothetical protein
MSGHPSNGYVAFLGMRLAQHAQALQGGNGKSTTSLGNRHGAMRFHGSKYLYVDAADLFPRHGWTVVAGVPVDQNPIRDHRSDPRMQAFFSRIMAEGGWQRYSNGPATPDGGADGDGKGFYEPCNTVLDKFYFLGSARRSANWEFRHRHSPHATASCTVRTSRPARTALGVRSRLKRVRRHTSHVRAVVNRL